MALTTFDFAVNGKQGIVTVEHYAGKKTLSAACPVIHVIARTKADFEVLDAYFKSVLGSDSYKESLVPPNHEAVHHAWDVKIGGFTPPHSTSNDNAYMYNHRHFELKASSSVGSTLKARLKWVKELSGKGIDLDIEDFS
jgi:hypothetical protein